MQHGFAFAPTELEEALKRDNYECYKGLGVVVLLHVSLGNRVT